MLTHLVLPMMLLLVPAKPPASMPSAGATIDRDSQPVFVIAGGKAGARILLDENTVPGLKEAAMTELVVLPGASVPEHTHDKSAELLYIMEGRASMTLGGKKMMVRSGMAIYIPAGVKHSLTMTSKVEPLRAIQVYTPGGPQQRFRKGKASKE